MIDTLTIVGVGLIGGSLAKAVRGAGFAKRIVGTDTNEAELKLAVQIGAIDEYQVDAAAAVAEANMIVLAVPVRASFCVFELIKDAIPAGAVLTDVGSSKVAVVRSAVEAFGAMPDNFVPGHPIAGREKSGVSAAKADLFQNHKVILTPVENTCDSSIQLVTSMWNAAGATVGHLGVEQHDLVLGATSHLPHVLAYATVDTLAKTDYVDEIFEYAAGGFRDFSRIASSDPVMWRDICLTNKHAILDVLTRFENHLAEIRQSIEVNDVERLTSIFASSKRIRDEFLEKHEMRQS